jgi:hypothetical protein
MALKQRKSPFDCENVEAIAAGVAADERAPGGEWYVRLATVWRSTHPVVLAHPEWFVPLGDGQTSAPYIPARS